MGGDLFPIPFTVSENPIFNPEIKLKDEVDKICDLAYNVLFKDDYESGKIEKGEIEKKFDVLRHAFYGAKHKFQHEIRNTGGDYIVHQISIAYDILAKSKTPTFKKLLTALHHDSIEDTDITYNGLNEDFGDEVALGVQVISKTPVLEFALKSTSSPRKFSEEETEKIKKLKILDENGNTLSEKYLKLRKKWKNSNIENNRGAKQKLKYEQIWLNSLSDAQKVEIIRNSGILNSKLLLSDAFKFKLKFHKERITLEQEFALELYKDLDRKYKSIRDNEYFSHMQISGERIPCVIRGFKKYPCLSNYLNHVYNSFHEQNKGNIHDGRDNDFFKKVMFNALEVKFWDRINNLETTEVYKYPTECNIKKAKRKIDEAEKYFYKIALEFDNLMGTSFAFLIKFEVEKLKNFIKSKKFENTENGVKGKIEGII